MSSSRDWKRVYDRSSGKVRYQHWSGGAYVDSINQLRPSIIGGGITGKGHTLKKAMPTPMEVQSPQEQAVNAGHEILKRLQQRSGSGITHNKEVDSITSRIKGLIAGKGMQVN